MGGDDGSGNRLRVCGEMGQLRRLGLPTSAMAIGQQIADQLDGPGNVRIRTGSARLLAY